MYILVDNGYKLYYNFNPYKDLENIEIINILFVNNNYFDLLLSNENLNIENGRIIDKNIDIKDVENIVIEDKNKNSWKINLNFDVKINKKIYVTYPNQGMEDYYNEIYRYLINQENMPPRLNYTKDKKRKTQENKNTFQKINKK